MSRFPLLNRLLRPSRPRLIAAIAVAALLGGVGDTRRIAHAAPEQPKAWFDAKGACVFPLSSGAFPTSNIELADSLTRAWKATMQFPDGDKIVQANGGQYPTLDSLHICLAGGMMDSGDKDGKKSDLRPSGKVESHLDVHDFDLDGHAMGCEDARFGIHICATDARLDVEHDKHGRPMVMLADAKNATLELQASHADLERLLVIKINEKAEKYGVTVHSAAVKLDAQNDRSIDVDVHLFTTFAFIPAGLHFRAHVDIDQSMVARLSKLKCDGDEALGPLIMSLIRSGLAKYEGKSKLVFSFPTGELKIHDFEIESGDQVKITANFARN